MDDGVVEALEEAEVLRLVDPVHVLGEAALLAHRALVVAPNRSIFDPLEKSIVIAWSRMYARTPPSMTTLEDGWSIGVPNCRRMSRKPLAYPTATRARGLPCFVECDDVPRQPAARRQRATNSRQPPVVAPARRVFFVALRFALLVKKARCFG
jgi:hypothetical protein